MEVEDGEKDAEEVDQNPDGIQHIVTIWSLGSRIMTIIWDQYQGSGLKDQDCKDAKDSDCIQHMVTIWSLGSRILTITKNQYKGSGLRIDIGAIHILRNRG